jgi:iron(III) transport system substrate-binding protein
MLRIASVLIALGLVLATVGLLPSARSQGAGEVNLYSYRQEGLIRPLLDAFTKATGVKVNLVSAGDDGIIERLKNEGVNSPADLLMTVDAGRLIRAKELGLFQPVKSSAIDEIVPEHLRDPEGLWVGLSVRARPIMYAPARVKPEELSTYEALAEPKWKGRVCVRSSSNVYNQSMLAAMIEAVGAETAEAWAKGFTANLARKPQGGDRDQIKALAAGECDVALVNTYYLGGLAGSPDPAEREIAGKVRVFWPNQNDRGAHVNVSGIGVAKGAKNKANAQKLIEFLLSDEAQRIYAEVVYEYPIKRNVPVPPIVAAFGTYRADRVSLAALAKHNAEAVRMFDRVGWR